MKTLFDKTNIGSIRMQNRFIRSATWEGLATPKGEVTPALIKCMTALAQSSVSLIISSHAYISLEGQGSPFQLGIYDDDLLDGYLDLTQAVHAENSQIILQITHAGHFAENTNTPEPPLAVSVFEGLSTSPRQELTPSRIKKLIEDFSLAAGRAKKAGFDGIQIHSAHGYLLNQFLSPAFNKRKDEYGGSLENRMRIHSKIYQNIRDIVGPDFPILIKLNSKDFIKDGLDISESQIIAQSFSKMGFNAIEISGGMVAGGKLSPSCQKILQPRKEAYFKKFAAKIKEHINIPLILVGGNRSLENMQQVLDQGTADYFAMSRPLICEPDLIKRWEENNKQKSQCISCNSCFQPGREGKGVYCVAKEKK